jgi:hypothetical protein
MLYVMYVCTVLDVLNRWLGSYPLAASQVYQVQLRADHLISSAESSFCKIVRHTINTVYSHGTYIHTILYMTLSSQANNKYPYTYITLYNPKTSQLLTTKAGIYTTAHYQHQSIQLL